MPPSVPSSQPASPAFAWQCPSNIALVKYWGKHGEQLPRNPSLSFTLREAHTQMSLAYQPSGQRGVSVDFSFEGQPNEKFRLKIAKFLDSVVGRMPFLAGLHLTIASHNSFPHSAGIASSASSMGALALCLGSLARALTGIPQGEAKFWEQASYFARLASGSACRSVYGGVTVWGQSDAVPTSSDDFAVPLPGDLHPVFADYRDSILLVSAAEKAVSSRAGHALMHGHPYAGVRYAQAHAHLGQLVAAMRTGDLDRFITIVENEALTLHGLMMNSDPSFILLQPNTLALIAKVRDYRQATGVPLCFTLDAGPNLHLLYPAAFADQVGAYIAQELAPLCEAGRYIHDAVGHGPVQLVG
jgi:diphosphomevalonate decarboxylase